MSYERSRKWTKRVTTIVIGGSTYFVVNQVLKANTPEQDSKIRKSQAAIGGVVIASVVAERCEEWSSKIVDDFFDACTMPWKAEDDLWASVED